MAEVLGPVTPTIVPSPAERLGLGDRMNWQRIKWDALSIDEQRTSYAYLRRDLVRGGIIGTMDDVNALFTSLSTIPGLERHEVLKRLSDLAPPPMPQIADVASLLINLSDPRIVERCIVALHDQQTPEEQKSEAAIIENNAGFSASTARYGTYLARWIKRGNRLNDKHM